MKKSRFTVTQWSSVLMTLAMLCNIMGGMKLFCLKEKSGPSENIPRPLVVQAFIDDRIVGIEPISDPLQYVQFDRQGPRCKCKKVKPCSAISRLVVTSNPIQRFSENQRQAWSERTFTMDAHEKHSLLKLRGDPLAWGRPDTDVSDPSEDILVLTSALLI